MMHPQRIVGLWDMIRLVAPNLMTSIFNVGMASECFVRNANDADARASAMVLGLNDAALSAFIAVDTVKDTAKNLGLIATIAHAEECERFQGKVLDHNGRWAMKAADLRHLGYALRSLSQTFSAEVGARQIFVISDTHARFYTDEPLFGLEVEQAFPSAAPEIADAAKCRALARWTACVMHLMRALEPGLAALQKAVEVSVPKEQWDQVINQVKARIREINRRTHGKADEQWFAEAASHFRLIKNAWRNHAQHLHERYDEERAVAIYDSVRAFMRHLATRLAE